MSDDELREAIDAVKGRKRLHLAGDSKRGQARPGSTVNAIAVGADGLGVAPLTWGFAAPDRSGKLVFNTRVESALGGSRMWAEAIREGRCILPAAAFFEPHRSETARSPRSGRTTKRQYEFSMPDGAPLLLASVQRDGRLSVVTTEPNASVAPVHPRMPLALRFEEVPTWLGDDFPTLADRSGLPLDARPEDGEDENPQLTLF